MLILYQVGLPLKTFMLHDTFTLDVYHCYKYYARMSLIFVGNNVSTLTIGVIAGMLGLLCILTVTVLVSCLGIIKCSRSNRSSFHTGQLALEPGPIYEDIQPSIHVKNECTVTEVNKNNSIALTNNDAYTIWKSETFKNMDLLLLKVIVLDGTHCIQELDHNTVIIGVVLLFSNHDIVHT